MLYRHLLCVKPFLGNFINFDLRVKIDKCYFEPIRTEQIFVQKTYCIHSMNFVKSCQVVLFMKPLDGEAHIPYYTLIICFCAKRA